MAMKRLLVLLNAGIIKILVKKYLKIIVMPKIEKMTSIRKGERYFSPVLQKRRTIFKSCDAFSKPHAS